MVIKSNSFMLHVHRSKFSYMFMSKVTFTQHKTSDNLEAFCRSYIFINIACAVFERVVHQEYSHCQDSSQCPLNSSTLDQSENPVFLAETGA